MDFSYLLDLAKQNEEHAREAAQIKRYSTQVSASKKIQRSAVQSQAIQAFLARKDQEDRNKKLEERKKKEELLSLRDRKSNARVQRMLKVTKSANKAVLDEVKGALNSTITCNEQPDEDDYGYVSHEASAFYKKLINKYSGDEPGNSTKSLEKLRPEQKKVKDQPNRTSDTKTHERRPAMSKEPLSRGKLERSLEKRAEKHIESDTKKSSKEKESKKTPSKPAEATLSFDQILKLAATKQHEPVKLEKKNESVEKKSPEPERPMTKKEKEELMRQKREERERQLRRQARESEGSSAVGKSINTNSGPSSKPKDTPAPKASSSKETRKPISLHSKPQEKLTSGSSTSSAQKSSVISGKPVPPQVKHVSQAGRGAASSSNTKPPLSKAPTPSTAGKKPPMAPPLAKPSLKEKSIPASREPSRPFPPYRRDHPAERPFKSYKRSIESDEEYDSELDDFIDDGPDDTADYSKHIQEIFGYDKSKYRRIVSDDEDECMESSFAQQMREERISTRIGIMEDLEEERREREEEERKRKLAAKRAKVRK